jgi:glycerol uptake operon antiterminator
MNIDTLLTGNPIIAAVRNDDDLERVLNSRVKIVFVLYGSILTIEGISKKLIHHDKSVFIHVDMIEGLKAEETGFNFIKKCTAAPGIITTKPSGIRAANALGLWTIQRIFILDSISLKTGINSICSSFPSAIEVLPGISSKILTKIKAEIKLPVIAGGLIETENEAVSALSCGAVSISTSKEFLWNSPCAHLSVFKKQGF